MMTPEQKEFIDKCRMRHLSGEEVTIEDMKRFVMLTRGNRRSAVDAAEGSKRESKARNKQPVSTDDALAGLENF